MINNLQKNKSKQSNKEFLFSMEGGELFNRIQDRTAFNERGNINFAKMSQCALDNFV